jgi:hypothetical protein
MESNKNIETQSQNKSSSDVREKIKKGLALTSKRLIEKAKKEKRELVVMQGNEIKKIRFS